jgi:hypothetical protein
MAGAVGISAQRLGMSDANTPHLPAEVNILRLRKCDSDLPLAASNWFLGRPHHPP